MYKLRFFFKDMCRYADSGAPCRVFTIWNVRSYTGKAIYDILNAISPCRPDLFPFIYWTVLTMSVLGFILSIFEFITIYHGSKDLSTFRSRRFKVIPFTVRRNARLVGSAFMAKANLLLLLGVATVSPKSMVPWLTVQTVCFCIEIAIWLFDILSNEDCLTFAHFMSYAMFIALWSLTQCVKDVFEDALQRNEAQDLLFLKKPF